MIKKTSIYILSAFIISMVLLNFIIGIEFPFVKHITFFVALLTLGIAVWSFTHSFKIIKSKQVATNKIWFSLGVIPFLIMFITTTLNLINEIN